MKLLRLTLCVCMVTLSTVGVSFANATDGENGKQQGSNPLRYYVGGKLGYSGINVNGIENTTIGKPANRYSDFLSSMGIGLFGGLHYSVMPAFTVRSELEYMYRIEGKKSKWGEYRFMKLNGQGLTPTDAAGNIQFEVAAHTILANLYLDYNITKKVTLYAGFGIGIGIIQTSIDAPSYSIIDDIPEPEAEKNSISFAWQAGIGTRVYITDHFALDINARYVGLSPTGSSLGNGQLLSMKYGMVGAVEALAGVSYMF